VSKVGQSAHSIDESKTYGNKGKDNTVHYSVDKDAHEDFLVGVNYVLPAPAGKRRQEEFGL
jgi:hypothetical protein